MLQLKIQKLIYLSKQNLFGLHLAHLISYQKQEDKSKLAAKLSPISWFKKLDELSDKRFLAKSQFIDFFEIFLCNLSIIYQTESLHY